MSFITSYDEASNVCQALAGGQELGCNRRGAGVEGVGSGGALTDAEAMARFGSVGPGNNAANRLRLSIADGAGEEEESAAAAAARARLMYGCGERSERGMAGGSLRISTRPMLNRRTESARLCEHSP